MLGCGVVGLSTDTPFDETGDNGSRVLRGMPPSVQIPDGSPDRPGAALMFAVGIQPLPIARVIVTNEINHQYLSAEKARRVLGWRALYSLDEGLERTIEWYRGHFSEGPA